MAQPHGTLILTLANGSEQAFTINKNLVSLGRSAANDVSVPDAKVSRFHAHLQSSQGQWVLIDLDSSNGTRVKGQQITRIDLSPGDVIAMGDSTLRFEGEVSPKDDVELTLLDSAADLEATLVQKTLETNIIETNTPRLAVHSAEGTWEVPIHEESISIGRDSDNEIVLNLLNVSRHHARIEHRGDDFIVRDLQSSNGTWIGLQKIEEHLLRSGDTIKIGDARLVFKPEFGTEDLTLVEAPSTGGARPRHPVVIVPGLMGSELWRGSERLWPNVRRLFTQSDTYRLPEKTPLEPRGIVNEVVLVPNLIKQEHYGRLVRYLEEELGYESGRDLLGFAYDWRQDVRDSAQRLAEAIDNWPATPPLVLIAHSLGCLVSRYYVERLGGKAKVGRLIFLGGPHTGVPKAISYFLQGADLLPFGLMGERLRQVLVTFPSMYQILPTFLCTEDHQGRPIEVLADEDWLPPEQRPLLKMAREFRQELGTRASVPSVSIFGYGLKTVQSLVVERDSRGGWKKFDFITEDRGDDSVPEASAVMEGSEIHPVQQHHGSLYVDSDVKMRLKLDLIRSA